MEYKNVPDAAIDKDAIQDVLRLSHVLHRKFECCLEFVRCRHMLRCAI